MKGFLFVLFCSVFAARAWEVSVNNLKATPTTGVLPPKHQPTADDLQATRKARTFINFLRFVPQLNPFRQPSLGPYEIDLPEFRLRTSLLLQNVLVSQLKQIKLAELHVQLNPGRIDFHAILPVVHASADFVANGLYSRRQVNTQGRFNVTINNLQVYGAVGPQVVPINGRNVYQVSDGTLTIAFDNAKLTAEMNQLNEEFRVLLQNFFDHVDQHQATVDDILRIILKGVSKELQRVTSNEILNYLLGNQAPSLNLGKKK